MNNLRARIIIAGAQTQLTYGTSPDALRRRAIKMLTMYEPGFGQMIPKLIEFQRSLGRVDGNISRWETISKIRYEDLTEDQLEWRKPKKK